MALEVIYDAIRTTAEDDSPVSAIITLPSGDEVVEGDVYLVIPSLGIREKGEYNETWDFIIPKDKKGRYMYYFELNGERLAFDAPIYFV